MRSLVTSIFLNACESWTLNKDIERKTQSFEMRCYRSILGIICKVGISNEKVEEILKRVVGPFKELSRTVNKRKFKQF